MARMIDPATDRLSTASLERVAALHADALPSSLVTILGMPFVREFYRFVARSPLERLVLCGEGDAITGACVLSLAPATLERRLAGATRMLLWMVARLPQLPLRALARDALRRTPRPPGSAPTGRNAPELILIFTDAHARGQGQGAELIAAVEAFLRARGDRRYLIRTFDQEDHAAVRFYRRHGFVDAGRLTARGSAFRLMDKDLTPPPA
ncbi:MAG TPA: GNAT family N-acetyltransferase [Stellaceae bacterium]|nr:GNAT family N-acetyltransferase [Stellaceae bacterium]